MCWLVVPLQVPDSSLHVLDKSALYSGSLSSLALTVTIQDSSPPAAARSCL